MHQTGDRTRRARRLRADPTSAEGVFWSMVRGRGLDGLKFRRETPLAGFVVDFYCPELRLVVELDGGVHRLTEERDSLRDERLREAGFTVLRFENARFMANPGEAPAAIRRHAAEMRGEPPHPSGFA